MSVAALWTTKVIINELEDALFTILIDESHDISIKEHIALILRFVDKQGCVIECFLRIIHVKETTAVSLKAATETLFFEHGLSIAGLCGRGYDGGQ